MITADPFYSMQLVSGVTLRAATNEYHQGKDFTSGRRRLEFHKLIRHFIAVCETIAYAHSQNVVHRDIKPENILLGEYGKTFVIDWGIASVDLDRSDHSVSGLQADRPLGTQGYMSPEQLRGELVGPEGDVFSLGATLYTILTGRKPYSGRLALPELESRIARIPNPKSSGSTVSTGLSSICMKALAARPEDRYSRVKDMANDLQCWLADEPIAALQESFAEKIFRWCRRNRYLATACGAVLTAAMIAFAISTLLISQEKDRTALAAQTAHENYQLARTVVDDLIVQVSRDQAFNQPGMSSIRAELLQKSLNYYQQFLQRSSRDEDLLVETADAHERISLIMKQISSQQNALQHLDQALMIRKKIHTKHPSPQSKLKLAGCFSKRAELTLDLGESEIAESEIRASFKLLKELQELDTQIDGLDQLFTFVLMQIANFHSDNGRYQLAIERYQEALDRSFALKLGRRVAEIHNNMGDSYRLAGEFDSALNAYRKCIAETDRLIANYPKLISYRTIKANALNQMGSIESLRQNSQSAIELLQASISELESISKLEPDVHEYQRMLADAYTEVGRLILSSDTDGAKKLLYSAAKIRRKLVANNPDDIGAQFNAAAANCGLAKLEMANENYDEAISHFNSAVQVFRALRQKLPNDPQIRVRGLACTLQALGEAYHENGDFLQAIELRQEALDIYRNQNESAASTETELKVSELSNELAESLKSAGDSDEAGKVLKRRQAELADSAITHGTNSSEERALQKQIEKMKRLLLDEN